MSKIIDLPPPPIQQTKKNRTLLLVSLILLGIAVGYLLNMVCTKQQLLDVNVIMTCLALIGIPFILFTKL